MRFLLRRAAAKSDSGACRVGDGLLDILLDRDHPAGGDEEKHSAEDCESRKHTQERGESCRGVHKREHPSGNRYESERHCPSPGESDATLLPRYVCGDDS